MKKIAVLTVFYNTKNFFYPLYESFIKMSGINIDDFDFFVYDNSDRDNDKIPLSYNKFKNVNIKYINPSILIKDIPSYNGSAKHTKTIKIALDNLKNEYDTCILLDSDVVITNTLKNYLEEFIKNDYTICGYHDDNKSNRNLIHPCAMFINLNHYKKYNLSFYDKNRMYGVKPTTNTYDTGMSFYEDVKKLNLKILEIPYNSYFNHFGAGSRDYVNGGKVKTDKIYRSIIEWFKDFKYTFEYKNPIISNCCLSGFLNKQLCKENDNPFTWCNIVSDSFYNIVKDYQNLNFEDYYIEKEPHKLTKTIHYKIILKSNKIGIAYPNYIEDVKFNTLKTSGVNVYWNNIKQYTEQEYKKHAERLIQNKNEPNFVILTRTDFDTYNYDYNYENTEKIIKIFNEKKYGKMTILTSFKELLKYNSEKCKIIYVTDEPLRCPQFYAENYFNEIIL